MDRRIGTEIGRGQLEMASAALARDSGGSDALLPPRGRCADRVKAAVGRASRKTGLPMPNDAWRIALGAGRLRPITRNALFCCVHTKFN